MRANKYYYYYYYYWHSNSVSSSSMHDKLWHTFMHNVLRRTIEKTGTLPYKFFREFWNIFDLVVVLISIISLADRCGGQAIGVTVRV